MKFTYGFARKKIHGKEYVYFWRYNGTGHKIEKYIGRKDKAETERRALQVELGYLESLQDELTARILKIKVELADEQPSDEEPSEKAKKMFKRLLKEAKRPAVKKKVKKKRKKVMQVETAVRP